MKSLLYKISFAFLVGFLLISLASGFSFDNVKSFEKKQGDKYGSITITNAYGFGSDLAKYKLTKNTDVCYTDCEAELTITLYSSGTLIDALKMKSITGTDIGSLPNQKMLIQTGQESYTEHTYEKVCTPYTLPNGKPMQSCTEQAVKNADVTKTRAVYSDYSDQTLPAGTYNLKIKATKKPMQTVDWVATGFGKEMTEWAYWIGISPSAYWKFNESTPNTAANLVDAAVVMTKVNSPLTVVGKLGNGVNTTWVGGANSMNTSVAGSYGNWTFGTGNLTVCYWANVPPIGGGGSRLHLSSFGGSWADSNSWAMSINGAGNLEITGKSASLGTATASINDGSWHRVCWVRSGSANRLYSDGINKGNFTNSNNFNDSMPLAVSPAGAGGGDTDSQKGMIDDLQIFKGYAWTQADITSDYNGGAGREADAPGTVNVTHSFPANNSAYNIPSRNVAFGANTTATAGAFNISIWTNAFGTYAINGTKTISGTTNSSWFNITFANDGVFFWAFEACDITGLCAITENRSVTINTSLANVSFTAPSGIYNYQSQGTNLTVTYAILDQSSSSCWLTYNGFNQTISCAGTSSTLNTTNYANRTATIFALSGSTLSSATTSWDYRIFEYNQRASNLSSAESALETFTSNVTYLASNYSSITPILGYGATNYSGLSPAFGSNLLGNVSIDIPLGLRTNNYTWSWNIVNATGTYNIPSNYLSTQAVTESLNFTFCQATPLNNSFINISFQDEVNSSRISAKVDASTFYYYLGTGTVNKTYTYSNSVGQNNYSFCATPSNRTLTTIISNFRYSNTNYPQRVYNDEKILSIAQTQKILYLLSSADGQYTTFQVVNSANIPLSGATVNIYRSDNGANQTTDTDGSGTVTFWVNPNYPLTITASKSGYPSSYTTITPSLTSYTLTLGSSSGDTVNDVNRGIAFTIQPYSNILSNNTSYNFNVSLTSSYWALTSWGFYLSNSSGYIISQNQSTLSSGGTLIKEQNTYNDSSINFNLWWLANGTYGNITKVYYVTDSSGTGWSLSTFFTDLLTYTGTGLFGLTQTGLNMLCLLFIIIATGIFSYKFGLSSPTSIIGVLFGLTFLLNVILDIFVPGTFGPTFMVGIALLAVIIQENI